MPAPNQMAITFAALRARIAHCEDLPLQKRRELRSAIHTFAKVCNRTPADIIADPAILRALSNQASWQLAGLSKRGWANILSRLRKALEIAGVAVHRQRRNFKLAPSWEQLLAAMTRRDHDELHRFAGWCSVHEIAPLDVTPQTFGRFLAYLEAQMTQRHPRERAHVARRAWNRTLAAAPGSPFPFIASPEPVGQRALRWANFPESLQQEFEAYRQRMLTANPLDETHRPIKPVTLENYASRLRIYLTGLVGSGIPIEHFASLTKLVEPATAKRGLELRLGTSELTDRERQDLHSIAIALLSVANFVGVDEAHRRTLRGYARKVQHRPNGLSAKNKERLPRLLNEQTKRRLIALPHVVAHDLLSVTKPTIRHAQRMQMAVLLDVLLHVPLRIRNAAELDLEKHIIRPVGGQLGPWRISIPAANVKNKVAIDAQLADDTSALLERYVTIFRPVLMKKSTTALFVSQNGQAKGASPLSKQFARFVRREVGLTVHAHLMRHFAAHLYLAANPGCYEDVRRMLGHTSLVTTVNSYAGTETAASFAHLDALLTGILKEASHKEVSAGYVSARDAEDVL